MTQPETVRETRRQRIQKLFLGVVFLILSALCLGVAVFVHFDERFLEMAFLTTLAGSACLGLAVRWNPEHEARAHLEHELELKDGLEYLEVK